MIDDALFFQLGSDALECAHFLLGMKLDPVRVDLRLAGEMRVEPGAELVVAGRVGLGDVEDDFVEVERVVVLLAEFELPGADVLGVVEDVLEVVEIDERALELVDVEFADFGVAGDFTDQPGDTQPAVGAGLVEKAAVDAVAGAVAQDHGAARVERGEDDLAGLALAAQFAGLGIYDLDERAVRVDVVARRAGVFVEGALGPRELGLGEAVGADDVDLFRAELSGEVAEFPAHSGGRFLAAEDDFFQVRQREALGHGLRQQMIDKGRHADEDVGFDLFDEAQIAVGAHRFPAARADDEGAEFRAAVVRDPEREVRREWEHVQHAHLALSAADFIEPRAAELEIPDVVRGVEEGDGLGAAARGAGEEQRAELALEALGDCGAAMQQGFGDGGKAPGEHGFVRHEDKVAHRIGAFLAGEEIEFRGERDAREIGRGAQHRGVDALFRKQASVVRGEGQHGVAQVGAQACELPVTQRLRVLGPVGFRVHKRWRPRAF